MAARRPQIYEYRGKGFIVGYNTHAWYGCPNHPDRGAGTMRAKGQHEGATCLYCKAPLEFVGYPAWVLKDKGGMVVEHVERVNLPTKKAQSAWVREKAQAFTR
jgi:hypothetical protein